MREASEPGLFIFLVATSESEDRHDVHAYTMFKAVTAPTREVAAALEAKWSPKAHFVKVLETDENEVHTWWIEARAEENNSVLLTDHQVNPLEF